MNELHKFSSKHKCELGFDIRTERGRGGGLNFCEWRMLPITPSTFHLPHSISAHSCSQYMMHCMQIITCENITVWRHEERSICWAFGSTRQVSGIRSACWALHWLVLVTIYLLDFILYGKTDTPSRWTSRGFRWAGHEQNRKGETSHFSPKLNPDWVKPYLTWRILHGGVKISKFIFEWWKQTFYRGAQQLSKILFSPLENKIPIFKLPCHFISIIETLTPTCQ